MFNTSTYAPTASELSVKARNSRQPSGIDGLVTRFRRGTCIPRRSSKMSRSKRERNEMQVEVGSASCSWCELELNRFRFECPWPRSAAGSFASRTVEPVSPSSAYYTFIPEQNIPVNGAHNNGGSWGPFTFLSLSSAFRYRSQDRVSIQGQICQF